MERTFKTALACLLVGATGIAACVEEKYLGMYTVLAVTGALLLTVITVTSAIKEIKEERQ